jgi:FkbM family methyltransferase
MNLLGEISAGVIRQTPNFKGKARLMKWWMDRCRRPERRRRRIGSAAIECDLSIPYEAMVWLRQEEEGDLQTLRRLLVPDSLFVDVGANTGLWSIVAGEKIGGEHVVSFEPNPNTAAKLRANLALSSKTAMARVHSCALGRKVGDVWFRCATDHNTSEVMTAPNSNSDCIQVPMSTLDELAHEWGAVQGIKIDAEGSELAILEGARMLLDRESPWLIVEFNTELAHVSELCGWDVHRFLHSMGYTARSVRDASLHCNGAPALPDTWHTQGYCNLFYTKQS